MQVQIMFALLLASVISLKSDSDSRKSRKHYGLSYHAACKDYIKTFTCMSACKSIGFQLFRMDSNCKCSCHELKTTTILPFFKWRTNGTTKSWVKTGSPRLYHIVGTLSPATYPDYTEAETETTGAGAAAATTGTGTGGTGGDSNSTAETVAPTSLPEPAKTEVPADNPAPEE